uniref:Uncharacterized protein n=1 Tax=Romanomermis culicivorax TaxID=13658 RepID=A0A915HVR0_ROMCU
MFEKLRYKKSIQSKCKSAVSLLESDADVNGRGKWAKSSDHTSSKVSHKCLYSPNPASHTSKDHLSSSRHSTQESNNDATPNKRIRFLATLEPSSPAAAVVNNGDQLNHFHGHCFDIIDHGTNSDSDDSGIGTASSTINSCHFYLKYCCFECFALMKGFKSGRKERTLA